MSDRNGKICGAALDLSQIGTEEGRLEVERGVFSSEQIIF